MIKEQPEHAYTKEWYNSNKQNTDILPVWKF